jgi:hypothetical protein
MTADDGVKALARDARRVAKEVRAIIERAEELGVNPEATPVGQAAPHAPDWEPVRATAGHLEGFAWGVAFQTQDNDLLGELTDGRRRFSDERRS